MGERDFRIGHLHGKDTHADLAVDGIAGLQGCYILANRLHLPGDVGAKARIFWFSLPAVQAHRAGSGAQLVPVQGVAASG